MFFREGCMVICDGCCRYTKQGVGLDDLQDPMISQDPPRLSALFLLIVWSESLAFNCQAFNVMFCMRAESKLTCYLARRTSFSQLWQSFEGYWSKKKKEKKRKSYNSFSVVIHDWQSPQHTSGRIQSLMVAPMMYDCNTWKLSVMRGWGRMKMFLLMWPWQISHLNLL